jgi:hypothetical protein
MVLGDEKEVVSNYWITLRKKEKIKEVKKRKH